LDTAIISIQNRFQQFKIYEENFGFHYNISSLKGWENVHLMDQCKLLHNHLLHDPDSMSSESDIDAIELCEELQILSSLVPENYTAQEVLQFIHSNNLNGIYPNISIALRILLTIPVTVASGERSFSCLKLIKTYLRSSMSQECLVSLAQLSIESDIAGQLDYSDILQDFSSVKAGKKQNN
uniref:HAT C-terminal dimerisation domain-containing protein n=1 Tax=Latimeria chalumnae TaxID=7897 RepID=H3BBT2_LATCH